MSTRCTLSGGHTYTFYYLSPASHRLWRKNTPRVQFNQHFIESLYSDINVIDPTAVFSLIFKQLPDIVTVYPSENYVYFRFQANGKTLSGNIRLDALDRDQGVLHLGYFEMDENGLLQDLKSYEKAFTAQDGVLVKRLSAFKYTVQFQQRTKTFHLHNPGIKPPTLAQLRKTEVMVGPVFDESGIQFFLLFDTAEKHFMYILNEEDKPIEHFQRLNERVLIGKRTGFAYYDDKAYKRRILIGVNGKNILRNNYYDGPFDQLPDNYIDKTHIQHYMEMAYPAVKGKINRFGHFKQHKRQSRDDCPVFYLF